MIPLVNLKRQYENIKDEVLQEMEDALASTAFICGPKQKAFEKSFAAMTWSSAGSLSHDPECPGRAEFRRPRKTA